MRLFGLCALLLITSPAAAQSSPQVRGTLIPDDADVTRLEASSRVNLRTGLPVALYHSSYRAAPSSPEEMALAYLRERGDELGIEDVGTLYHVATRSMLSGYRVRFQQHVGGVPVYKSVVAVSVGPNGQIQFVTNGYKSGVRLVVVASKTGGAQAMKAAASHVAFEGPPSVQQQELVIYAEGGVARLAHRVQQVTAQGAWDVLVDASSGSVFRAEATAHSNPPGQAAPLLSRPSAMFGTPAPQGVSSRGVQVDGTAMVFDPDPMTTLSTQYGESAGVQDNSDQDSDELTAARRQVALRNITDTGSEFTLEGPLVVVTDFDPPFLGTFSQASPDFDFTRSQPGFEATNVYYHIEHSMRYLNEELGIAVVPLQYSGGVQVDPHGLEGAVNAQYLFTGQLRFGEGGADMAEDPEVVLHELGHAIHDWITNRGLSQEAGLGEGSADYWAASYTRSWNAWPSGDARADNFGRWGGRPFFSGRSTDYAGRFPFDLTGAIHTDGQIWSSAMISILDQIGRDKSDRLFLEGLSMTGSGSNTEDAARAVLKADSLLFGAADADVMINAFVERGFLFRAVAAGIGIAGPGPRAVTFFDVSTFGSGSANSWAWDFQSDGVIDATSAVTNFTYETPGLHSVTLTASDGTRTETTTLTDYVSVNSGVYVWEGFGQPAGRSGRYIFEALQEAGIESYYSRTAKIHPSLEGFDAVFVSFGPFDPQGLPSPLGRQAEQAIREYIAGGGNLYLEGGDALGFDQASNDRLLTLFGIDSSTDGTTQSISDLVGESGTLAEGLVFTSSRQTANGSVDEFSPGGSGRALFTQQGYGVVGVQNSDAGGGKTVAMSYTLADLEANGSSTRDAALIAIMDFFGMPIVLDAEGSQDLPSQNRLRDVYPNPSARRARVRFDLALPSMVSLEVYDLLGRRVLADVNSGWKNAGTHEATLATGELAAGTYLVRLVVDGVAEHRPLVVVR
ncbi:MAG: PKD repeat protein [Rhodothermales bacterium]|jgi:PKD repeat protein